MQKKMVDEGKKRIKKLTHVRVSAFILFIFFHCRISFDLFVVRIDHDLLDLEIRGINHHTTHTHREREEGLTDSREDGLGRECRLEVRREEEAITLDSIRHKGYADSHNDEDDEECGHHHLRRLLDALLHTCSHHAMRDKQEYAKENYILPSLEDGCLADDRKDKKQELP